MLSSSLTVVVVVALFVRRAHSAEAQLQQQQILTENVHIVHVALIIGAAAARFGALLHRCAGALGGGHVPNMRARTSAAYKLSLISVYLHWQPSTLCTTITTVAVSCAAI